MDANQAWIAMFRRIPADLHDTLALGLTTGAEIVVQKIVKLEPDFMIIRGRLAGTQDAGRIVMIPYSQLTFVAVIRDLQEAEIEAIFGKPRASAAVARSAIASASEEPTASMIPDATVNDPTAAVNPARRSRRPFQRRCCWPNCANA